MKPKISWSDVQIRDFTPADLKPYLDYWYRSPDGFIIGDLVNPDTFPKEPELKARMEKAMQNPATMHTVVIEFQGRAIGVQNVNTIENRKADFHAHFWDESARGRGIGPIAAVKAARLFMERFQLDRIFFKPPKNNPMSSGAAKKWGLKFLGEEELKYPIIQPGTIGLVYVAEKSDLDRLEALFRAAF